MKRSPMAKEKIPAAFTAYLLAGVRAVREEATNRQRKPLTQPKETLEIPNLPDG